MQKIDNENERFECPECSSILLRKNFKINSKGLNVCPICSYEFKFMGNNEPQSSFLKIDSETLNKMSVQYRKIRYAVFNEATKPLKKNSGQHDLNKSKLKSKVIEICTKANLHIYNNSSQESINKLWHHLWTKNRYAGIKARIASQEIEDIKSIFDEYEIFSNSSWNISCSGHNLISAGDEALNFLNREGQFYGRQTIGNLPKLVKIVSVARKLVEFSKLNKNIPAIHFLTDGYQFDDVWNIHEHLMNIIGYTGDLTALHCMMDLGFQVMKPDIIISRLFLKLGWLHKIIPDLPQDFAENDLQGKGDYSSRFIYTKPQLYKPIIELSRIISANTSRDKLAQDIGWVTDNPLREFDIFMVKYGQQPEPDWGIIRTLMNSN